MKNGVIAVLVITNILFAALAIRKGGKAQVPVKPADTESGETRSAQPDAASARIGYITMEMNNPYWRRVESGMRSACEKFGGELTVKDPQLDSAKQISEAEDLLQTGVDAVLLSPITDETCTKVEELCKAKGVPVIVVDVGPGKGDYACLTISDNAKGSYLAGKYIKDNVKAEGPIKVAWLQIPQEIYAGRLRSKGFKQAVDEFGFVVAAGPQVAAHRKDVAVQTMEDFLVKAPDLNAVFCENDEMALGALQAIKADKKLDQIMVVGFDGNPDALEAIKKGEMAATVAQDPELMGRMAIVNAYQVFAGTLDINARQDIYVPIKLITPKDVKGE
jgi:ribose transport system substrate-binding protein